jgi:hypothetical protein
VRPAIQRGTAGAVPYASVNVYAGHSAEKGERVQTIFDVAAVLSALLWPTVVLIVFIAYYNRIPDWISGLAGRVTKLQVTGISLELASAKAFAPDWTSPTALDLRSKATALQVTDSTAGTFLEQLRDHGSGDYAEVNLGSGDQWLTSRLFIIAILYARMKGIHTFVFLESRGVQRKCYLGCVDAGKLRWALARHFPWFERAYAEAYRIVMSTSPGALNHRIVSHQGRIGYSFNANNPSPGIDLLTEYLRHVQEQTTSTARGRRAAAIDEADWVFIEKVDKRETWEHAEWLDGAMLETILGDDLNMTTLPATGFLAQSREDQIRQIVGLSGDFVALVNDEQRLENLVNRRLLLGQVAATLTAA